MGLSTPAGVKIGMTYSEVVRLLGEPYYIEKGTIGYYGEGDSGSLHIDMDTYSIDGNSKVKGIQMNTNRPRTQPTQQQPVKKNTLPTRVTQINKIELNIGGINRGQAMEYVEKVYGKPNVIDDQGFYHVNDMYGTSLPEWKHQEKVVNTVEHSIIVIDEFDKIGRNASPKKMILKRIISTHC